MFNARVEQQMNYQRSDDEEEGDEKEGEAEEYSDDDEQQRAVGSDKGASERTVRRLLRASTAAVRDEMVRARQTRPSTTSGGVFVQTALNFSGSKSCARSHKASVEQLDQLQRAARYRLRTDPCKLTGFIIPPLLRVNTDRAATVIFSKTTSRRIKRRVKQTAAEDQNQATEADDHTSTDDDFSVKTSRSVTITNQQQEEDDQPPISQRFVHANQQLYLNACKKLNVVHAEFFCKHLVTDAVVMKHHILGELGTKACCIALTTNSFVKRLHFQDNAIGSEGATYIAEMMQENVNIIDLTVAENNIGTTGMQVLSDVLKAHIFLTRLDLSGNHLGDADIKPIIVIIESNSALRHLILHHNDFATKAAIDLSTCLAKNSTLESLDLGWNHFSGQGIAMLCDGITKNKNLTHLNLEWNGLAVEGSKAIARTLRLNKVLLSVDISNNRINLVSLELILKSLKSNVVLRQLHLRGNSITLGGAKLILQTLQQCINLPLNDIDITGQSVDEDFMRTLAILRLSRPTLQITHSYVLKENIDTSNVDHFPEDNPVTVFLEFVRLKRCQPYELFTLEADQDTVTHDEFRKALKVNKLSLTMAAAHNITKQLDPENTGVINVKALFSNLKAHEKRVKAKQQDKSVPFEDTPLGRVSGRITKLLPELQPIEIEDTETTKVKKKKADWMVKMLDDIDGNED